MARTKKITKRVSGGRKSRSISDKQRGAKVDGTASPPRKKAKRATVPTHSEHHDNVTPEIANESRIAQKITPVIYVDPSEKDDNDEEVTLKADTGKQQTKARSAESSKQEREASLRLDLEKIEKKQRKLEQKQSKLELGKSELEFRKLDVEQKLMALGAEE